MGANSNKNKGNNLERKVRLDLLKYWDKIKTSRMGSKQMDDCRN